MIHPTAIVLTSNIGANTSVWQFCVVSEEVFIGSDCNICSHCFIEKGVIIGDRVTVKNGVQLWTGLSIGNDVFIGPNVTFCNDRKPRSKRYPSEFQTTVIKSGASIGAGAVILPGLSVGHNALVGAGAVVTSDVKDFAQVQGCPAKQVAWVGKDGKKLQSLGNSVWECISTGTKFLESKGILKEITA